MMERMTITEFLLAQIAEDEATAINVLRFEVRDGIPGNYVIKDRVLSDCEAKRRIVDLHQRCDVHDRPGDECDACQRCGDGSLRPCDTLLAVALVYADHPDFDPAWRVAD